MTLRQSLKIAAQAARTNFLPGLLLQALMILFFAAYTMHEGTRSFLVHVAELKNQTGYVFSFCSYIIAAAVLPEILRMGFFHGGKIHRQNLWNILTGALIWGFFGIVVDMFYRLQGVLFGIESTWTVIAAKMLVDQFLFSPLFGAPFAVGMLAWRDARFRPSALRSILTIDFLLRRVLPVQVAGWFIWIPGVCLIYFMPPLLEVPVAVLIQIFWVLILTTVGERTARQRVAVECPVD